MKMAHITKVPVNGATINNVDGESNVTVYINRALYRGTITVQYGELDDTQQTLCTSFVSKAGPKCAEFYVRTRNEDIHQLTQDVYWCHLVLTDIESGVFESVYIPFQTI